MKKKKLMLFLLFCFCLSVSGARGQTINNVEYWFDNGFSTRTQASITTAQAVNITELVPGSLTDGLHSANIRAKDNNNAWSVVHSQNFYKLPVSTGTVSLTNYEYWIDNVFAGRLLANNTGQSLILSTGIDLSLYGEGLHSIAIRAKDSNGRWSSVHSKMFFKLPVVSGSVSLTNYEYWVDDVFAGRINTALTGSSLILSSNLNIGSVSEGLHKLNIRAKDSNNRWSSVYSQLFFRLPVSSGTVTLTNYEYWVDDAFAGRVNTALAGQQLILTTSLDVISSTEGFHKFNIRTKDSNGRWSSVQSQFFYKLPITTNGVLLSNCEYWVDDAFAERVNVSISGSTLILNSNLMPGSINEGFHKLNIRIKDSNGRWSTVHSQFFYKNNLLAVGTNTIDAYRYWFDKNFSNQQLVTLTTPATPENLITKLVVPGLQAQPKHYFHIQFRDLTGKWSVAQTDSFTLGPVTGLLNSETFVTDVFPNPFTESFYLNSGNFEGKTQVGLYNSVGICVFSQSIYLSKNSLVLIPVPTNLMQGTYILKVSGIKQFRYLKIIKK